MVETVNALLRGTIELKRAELILRALNTAVRNIRRVHFGLHASDMVKEIPDYPIPPLEEVDEQYAAELRRHARKAFNGNNTSGQQAASPAESAKTTSTPPANTAPTTAASTASLPADRAEAPPRKPPVSVKQSPASARTTAPKERQIAARRAGGG